MISDAWYKSPVTAIGHSRFKATRIHPQDPYAVPEHFQSIADSSALNRDGNLQLIQNIDLPLSSTSTSLMNQYDQISQTPVLSQAETPRPEHKRNISVVSSSSESEEDLQFSESSEEYSD